MSGQVCTLAIRAIAVASQVVVSLILVMARSGHIYSTNTHTFSSSLKFLRDNMHACIFQDSASSLTLCPANNGISKDTVHVTLRAYVDVLRRRLSYHFSVRSEGWFPSATSCSKPLSKLSARLRIRGRACQSTPTTTTSRPCTASFIGR